MIAGKCIKKSKELKWFQWLGYSVTKLEEFKAWIESNGDNFDDKFKMSGTNLRLYTSTTVYFNIHEGSIVLREITGEYYVLSIEKFKDNYDII